MQSEETLWLEKAQQGDRQSFSYLVEAYQTPVYNLCYRMLGSAADAEDAAQEVFIRAYKAIKRYDPSRKFSTWILSITSNYCIDQYRRRKLPTFSYDELPEPDIPDRQPAIETNLTNMEDSQHIQAMLEHLSPVDRAAVILLYWYEYSYDEIAAELNLSVSAVKSRLHRARRDLALLWSQAQAEMPISERKHYESPVF